jgi:phosphate transport system substrate-binding protein
LGSARLHAAPEPDYLSELTAYQPQQSVSGTIRVWGNPYIPELVEAWEEGFHRIHPGITFTTTLKGTEAAMAGLYGRIADVVLLGREAYQAETAAFEERFGYAPLGVKITSGSYATPHKTFALMVYVHHDNPLVSLTLTQLDALYSAARRRGARDPVQTWGQLGLSGAWAARPVHVYGYQFDTGMARFLRHEIFKDSYRWNPELKDFDNGRDDKGEVINAGVYITRAVAGDPDGIGISNVMFEVPGVKTVSLGEIESGPFVAPSKETAFRRTYPLTRFSTAFINRPPGEPIDPKLKEFLRYILSKNGMDAVVRDAAFLPLNADVIDTELQQLN